MSYNISLIDNITGPGSIMGFLNVNAGGMYFVMFILTLIIIIALVAIRNNVREFKAIFYGFAITLLPTVLLATIESFGTHLVPYWYVGLHITLMSITGVFAYMNK